MRHFIKHMESFIICDKWADERIGIGLSEVICS
jgi:hypothetical protein